MVKKDNLDYLDQINDYLDQNVILYYDIIIMIIQQQLTTKYYCTTFN